MPGVPDLYDAVLRRELEARRWPVERMEADGVLYRGPAGFVLRHGERYEPTAYPRDGWRGYQLACYANAIVLAETAGLAYVEGFAMAPVYRGGEVFMHAWNRGPQGELVDSTWLNTGAAYLGVVFHHGRADDATWNGDACVLDDRNRGWPLLREPWTGEDFEREWTPTEMLLVLRNRDREGFRRLDARIRATGS